MPTARRNFLEVGLRFKRSYIQYFLLSVDRRERPLSRFAVKINRTTEANTKPTIDRDFVIRGRPERYLLEYLFQSERQRALEEVSTC